MTNNMNYSIYTGGMELSNFVCLNEGPKVFVMRSASFSELQLSTSTSKYLLLEFPSSFNSTASRSNSCLLFLKKTSAISYLLPLVQIQRHSRLQTTTYERQGDIAQPQDQEFLYNSAISGHRLCDHNIHVHLNSIACRICGDHLQRH